MGRERWFRGGHEGRERPFDWYTLAKERDIPLEQARVLYEEALRRAKELQEGPHRNAEALYLELLDEARREARRLSPGKVSLTMLMAAERAGKKRPKPKPLAPGRRTLTSYLEPPNHVRHNSKRAKQECERLEAIAESFRALGMTVPADLQSALARVQQVEPPGQTPEVAEVGNLASPDASTRTTHPARERLMPGTAAYRRFQRPTCWPPTVTSKRSQRWKRRRSASMPSSRPPWKHRGPVRRTEEISQTQR